MASSVTSYNDIVALTQQQKSSARSMKLLARTIYKSSTLYTDAKVTEEINKSLTTAYKVKGSVYDYASLHNTRIVPDPSHGDVYSVQTKTKVTILDRPGIVGDAYGIDGEIPAGTSFVYIMGEDGSTGWDPMGGSIDLSPYAKIAYVDQRLDDIANGVDGLPAFVATNAKLAAHSNYAVYACSRIGSSTNSNGELIYSAIGADANPICDTYLKRSGGLMTGELDMYANAMTNFSYIDAAGNRTVITSVGSPNSIPAYYGIFSIRHPKKVTSYNVGISMLDVSNQEVACMYYDSANKTLRFGSKVSLKETGYKMAMHGILSVTESINTPSVNTDSDRRLKENIEEFDADLSKIKAYSYNFKENPTVPRVGLMAQDVREVIPQAVTEVNDHLTLDYNSVVAVLVNKVNQLESRLAEMESEIIRLKGI